MMGSHQISYILTALLALLYQCNQSNAFSTLVTPAARQRTSTNLNAWSLEIPDGLGSFKSTWYNTVENPTARRTIYDDAPNEFRFVTAGSDWPSAGEDEASSRLDMEKPRVQINPIRRAAEWILRRRR